MYDAFPLAIHPHRAQPRGAQAVPALRGGTAVCRVVSSGPLPVLRPGVRANPGDTWAFVIIGDRLPIGAIIVLIYFGVVRSHPVVGLTMMVVFAALLLWTAPNRWGAGIALHYLSRVYWPEPADPIPPPPATRPR